MSKRFLLATREDGVEILINFDYIKWIKPFERDNKYSIIHTGKNEELLVEGKFNVLIQRIIEG